MKSASVSDKRTNLKSFLKRVDFTHFRPIEADDIKYAFAGYRKGVEDWKGVFPEDLAKDEFVKVFHAYASQFQGIWTVFAETPEGRHASGMVFGWIMGWGERPVLTLGDMIWFPWASKRNILEGAVTFLNATRQDFVILEYARPDDVRFFERLDERYGLMRRVGAVHDIYDTPAMLFQSRTPEHMRVY